MKTIITKLLILILIINAIIPITAFANDTLALYNRGEEVILENDLYTYNGDKYIHEKDLYLLNLEWDGNTLSDMYYNMQLYITHGSSTVFLNDESFLFPNASVKYSGNYYISLRLIGMFLSDIYEVTDSSISLWISDEEYTLDFVKGIVSLPDNQVAPVGGISVEVFVTDPDGPINGGGSGGGGSAPIVNVTPTVSTQIGQLGYDGINKPSFNYIVGKSEAYVEYDKLVSKNVLIEEGNNSVEFYLSLAGEDFTHSDVGYYTEINGYPSYGFVGFSGKTELYEFVIKTEKTDIKGTVTLPDACEEDTKFVIVAEGEYGYKYEGTIPEGNISSDYTLSVDTESTYDMTLYFPNSEYVRSYNGVEVGNVTVEDVDFTTKKSNSYEITMSLPDDYISTEDIDVNVYIQSAIRPYYYINKKQVTISAGTKSAIVNILDDLNSKKVILYYSLDDEYDGLFDFGHYSSNGTSFDCANAEAIKPLDNVIEMTLLRSKNIDANISLPKNEIAESDISVNIEPITSKYPIDSSGSLAIVTSPSATDEDEDALKITYPTGNEKIVDYEIADQDSILSVTPITDMDSITLMSTSTGASSGISGGSSSTGGGGGSTSVVKPITPVEVIPTIAEGENQGTTTIVIPDEEGYGYILELRVSDDSESYFRKIYYNSDKSTVLRKNASIVESETTEIEIELIKQYEISGSMNAVGFLDSANRITAICQEDESIMEDIYDSQFSIYTDIYGSGTYNIYVPDEFDKYILKLYSFNDWDSIYYNTPKSVEKIDDAKIITVNEDVSNIDFEYDGYNPATPIEVQAYQTTTHDRWAVVLSNISDFDRENITVRAALYKEGRLQNIISEDSVSVAANEKSKLFLTVPDSDLASADLCKLFVWDNSLRPLANVTFLKDERTGPAYSEKDIALLYCTKGNKTMYSEGQSISLQAEPIEMDETIYLPLHAFSEALNIDVEWTNEDSLAVFTNKAGDKLSIFIDEVTATFNSASISVNNPLMIVNQRVYAPVRDIAEIFGYIVQGNVQEGRVSVYDKKNYLIERLTKNDLIPEVIYGYSVNEKIYRRQIADVLVDLYETINGRIEITEESPYSDINTEAIVKAYCAEILVGYEDGEFKPLNGVYRSEVVALFQRVLIKSGITMPDDVSNTNEYTDITKKSDHWARDIVYQMSAIGALDNVFGEKIGINDLATIKDVLAICQNCYDILK